MKTFNEFITESIPTPPPVTGEIEGDMKTWAQDKLASKMQWHLDQINSLDLYSQKEQLDDHQQQITKIRQYMQ